MENEDVACRLPYYYDGVLLVVDVYKTLAENKKLCVVKLLLVTT